MRRRRTLMGLNAVLVLVLTVGLSAQRYTGHDHGVFHRPQQSPPANAKHQSPPSSNGTKAAPKSAPTSTAPQPVQHAATQNKPETVSNGYPAPPTMVATSPRI